MTNNRNRLEYCKIDSLEGSSEPQREFIEQTILMPEVKVKTIDAIVIDSIR